MEKIVVPLAASSSSPSKKIGKKMKRREIDEQGEKGRRKGEEMMKSHICKTNKFMLHLQICPITNTPALNNKYNSAFKMSNIFF